MESILYFPYINLPQTAWTLRTLLYYDTVGSIVPQEYFFHPEKHYDPFMLELVRNELVIPIDPMRILDTPKSIAIPFISFLESNRGYFNRRRLYFHQGGNYHKIHIDKFSGTRIYADKFDKEIFYQLRQLGLARQDVDNHNLYLVENYTAAHLMKFLASLISTKLNMQATTDNLNSTYFPVKSFYYNKRMKILERLIPFPEEINLTKLRKFKDLNFDLLKIFKNRIEQIVLDENLVENSELFNIKVEELIFYKNELSDRMNQSQIKNIFWGSVCGIFGAYQGLATANTFGAFVGGLPGFANAIYSALRIENPENIYDQTGIKYLALLDKKIRYPARRNL